MIPPCHESRRQSPHTDDGLRERTAAISRRPKYASNETSPIKTYSAKTVGGSRNGADLGQPRCTCSGCWHEICDMCSHLRQHLICAMLLLIQLCALPALVILHRLKVSWNKLHAAYAIQALDSHDQLRERGSCNDTDKTPDSPKFRSHICGGIPFPFHLLYNLYRLACLIDQNPEILQWLPRAVGTDDKYGDSTGRLSSAPIISTRDVSRHPIGNPSPHPMAVTINNFRDFPFVGEEIRTVNTNEFVKEDILYRNNARFLSQSQHPNSSIQSTTEVMEAARDHINNTGKDTLCDFPTSGELSVTNISQENPSSSNSRSATNSEAKDNSEYDQGPEDAPKNVGSAIGIHQCDDEPTKCLIFERRQARSKSKLPRKSLGETRPQVTDNDIAILHSGAKPKTSSNNSNKSHSPVSG